MAELSPDTSLSHYRIVSKIGAGGMGEVYLAEDARLDRKVALKILPANLAANHDRMRRFVQEAKAASALNHPNIIGTLGYAYAKSGRKAEARKLLAELKELSKGRYVASYWIAMIYVGLDEKDQAFAWLEKAYQERSWWLVWIKMDPMVDSLRSDSRFIDLMRRIGFPQ